MKHRGPFLHDDLDKPNIYPMPPPQPKIDWRIYGVISAASIVAFIIFVWIVFSVYGHLEEIRYSYNGIYSTIATLIIWFFYLVPVLIIGTVLYHVNRYLSVLTKRAALINVMEYQTTLANLDRVTKVVDKFIPVMMERAKQSKFAGVQTLTYDDSKTVANQETLAKLLEEPIEEDDDSDMSIADGNEPILIALREKGLINRSNNSILIGFGEKKK